MEPSCFQSDGMTLTSSHRPTDILGRRRSRQDVWSVQQSVATGYFLVGTYARSLSPFLKSVSLLQQIVWLSPVLSCYGISNEYVRASQPLNHGALALAREETTAPELVPRTYFVTRVRYMHDLKYVGA